MSADQPAHRPRSRPAPDRLVVSRRALGTGLVGIAATALLTSGCDTDDGLDLPGLPTIGEEPDQDRVVAGLRDEQAVLDQVVRVRRRHRTLRGALAPTEAVHRSHVELLGRAVDTDDAEGSAARADGAGRQGRVPGDPVEAVAQLVGLERSLAERHVATAMRSRSGTLARVVAAMSAAAAQQAVVLTPLAVETPERWAEPMSTSEEQRPLSALQETLAAEHAAVHVYAVLGGRVSALTDPVTADRLRTAYEAHRARRDQLRSVIADLGREPEAAAAAYRVDARTRDADELLRVARLTEDRCAAVYAQLVAGSSGDHRRWAIAALTDAAVRVLSLGGAADAYPGAAELERRG